MKADIPHPMAMFWMIENMPSFLTMFATMEYICRDSSNMNMNTAVKVMCSHIEITLQKVCEKENSYIGIERLIIKEFKLVKELK